MKQNYHFDAITSIKAERDQSCDRTLSFQTYYYVLSYLFVATDASNDLFPRMEASSDMIDMLKSMMR